MACVVGLDVDVLVVVGCKLVGVGPVLGNVASEGPHSKMYLAFHAVDSPLDETACTLVLLTPD